MKKELESYRQAVVQKHSSLSCVHRVAVESPSLVSPLRIRVASKTPTIQLLPAHQYDHLGRSCDQCESGHSKTFPSQSPQLSHRIVGHPLDRYQLLRRCELQGQPLSPVEVTDSK